jgi:predicted HicB family RNase H-like nuclease
MSTRKRPPSPAAQAARARLEALAPEAAAALGEHYTVEDVQKRTLQALEAAAATPPALVSMNVRIPRALKARAVDVARKHGVTLQAVVAEALEVYIENVSE